MRPIVLPLVLLLSLVASAVLAASPALKPGSSSKALPFVEKGIAEYNQGYWPEARKYFADAVNADATSAEAHYDLALTLDKLGDHKAATDEFIKAYQLGKGNPLIQNSAILRAHLR